MENLTAHVVGIRAEIARVFKDDKPSLKRLFLLLGELDRVSEDLRLMDATLRREYLREVLEDKLKGDRDLQLLVLRLRREFRAKYLEELSREYELLWLYYLILIEMKIRVVTAPCMDLSSTDLSPKRVVCNSGVKPRTQT